MEDGQDGTHSQIHLLGKRKVLLSAGSSLL